MRFHAAHAALAQLACAALERDGETQRDGVTHDRRLRIALGFWKAAIGGHRTSEDDLAHAVALIRRHGALDATRERARHFAQRAVDALAIFPAGKAREAMVEAAQFAVSRGY